MLSRERCSLYSFKFICCFFMCRNLSLSLILMIGVKSQKLNSTLQRIFTYRTVLQAVSHVPINRFDIKVINSLNNS